MSVRFVKQFRTYFPNDVATFAAAREAELIAGGVAVAHVGDRAPAIDTSGNVWAPKTGEPAGKGTPESKTAPEPQTGGEGGPARESNTSLGPEGAGRDLSQIGDASKGEQSNAEDTDQQTFKQPGITPDNGQGDALVPPASKQEETDRATDTAAHAPDPKAADTARKPVPETTNRQTHTDGRSGGKTKTK